MGAVVPHHPEDWVVLGYSLLFFGVVWILATVALTAGGWKPGTIKANTVSSCLSLIHGTSTTFLAGREVYMIGSEVMDAPNTLMQERIMQFSMAYFFIDIAHCWYYDLDYLFIGHHSLTNTYMIWCSTLGRGAMSVMMLMFSGECTSTLQNVWSVAGDNRAGSRAAARVFELVQAPFTVFFSASRLVMGPCFLYYVISGLHASPHLSLMTRVCWSCIAVTGCCGSWLWVKKLVLELRRDWAAKAEKEVAAAGKRR